MAAGGGRRAKKRKNFHASQYITFSPPNSKKKLAPTPKTSNKKKYRAPTIFSRANELSTPT
jgi:hypothetical protein